MVGWYDNFLKNNRIKKLMDKYPNNLHIQIIVEIFHGTQRGKLVAILAAFNLPTLVLLMKMCVLQIAIE